MDERMTSSERVASMDKAIGWLKEFSNRCWQDGIQIGKNHINKQLTDRITELEAHNAAGICHVSELEEHITELKAQRKSDCVNFFRWFWNQPGTNADQGYDEWITALKQGNDDG